MLIDKQKIEEAKELLGESQAHIIAEELNVQNFDERNLKACCPFHQENTPSFIYDKKHNKFRCFGACQRSWDLIDVYQLKGFTFAEAAQKLLELAGMSHSFGEHKVKTLSQYRYPKEVECTDKTKVYEYLKLRGISEKTADYLDIRQDPEGNLVLNYYDTNDVLTMVKYRPSHKINKENHEIKNWCQKDADTCPLLFNMHRINPTEPLLICSGELDCAAAIESGWQNTVSIPLGDGNTHWIEQNWEWLDQFDSIIIAADNDESGRKFRENVIPRLGSWRCKTVQIPETYTKPGGNVVPIKDINEALVYLGKEETLHLIQSAKDNPLPSVIDMSDVKSKDYTNMPGVETGISCLDKELMRLFYGTLTVITGLPGSGKSSILSEIIVNALEQDVNTWMFSGELSESMVKNWSLYVLAGPRHVQSYYMPNGDTYYRIEDGVEDVIDEHYRGKWFLYRDDFDKDIDSLLDAMQGSVRKYGCRLFILDNFMTIDIGNSDDELRQQTVIVKKLIDFSKKYNAATILVCHPRKMQKTSNVGIQDISGTSNIINLAHRTFGLRKITEQERCGFVQGSELPQRLKQYDVVLNIIKDRIRGRSGIQLGLYYDKPSRRFYTTQEEYDRQYSWDPATYDGKLAMPDREPLVTEVIGESEPGGN